MRKILVIVMLMLFSASITFASGQQDAVSEKPEKLIVWCNDVHRSVTDGTARGAADLTKEFEKEFGVEVEWVPIAWAQMLEKIQLELNVAKGEPHVVFGILDWATPAFLGNFADLSPYLNKNPIEHMEDFPQGGINAFTYEGGLRLVPYRSNIQLLHYNNELFSSFAVDVPKTMEELGEAAKKISHKRDDGADVYGLAFIGNQTLFEIIRAFGGDVLDESGKYVLDSPETREAVLFMKDLYDSGAIPPNFDNLSAANNRQLYYNGLLGMMFQGDNYYYRLNDPNNSQIAGNSLFDAIPPAEDLPRDHADVKLALWGAGIPKNSDEAARDLSYEFIKFLTSRNAQLEMGLNGNSPSRSYVYEQEAYIEEAPYSEVSAEASNYASPLIPAVNGVEEITDIAVQEISRVIKGTKKIDNAMSDAGKKILAVLEREAVTQ